MARSQPRRAGGFKMGALGGLRLNEWERKGIEERCEGWWPSLAAFVAEQMSGTKSTPPAELLGVLEEVGRSWIAEERFSLLEDDSGEGGVFVIRGGWW